MLSLINCFASNKNLIDIEKLKPNLKREIKKLIIDFSASEFYVCLESNFDRLYETGKIEWTALTSIFFMYKR